MSEDGDSARPSDATGAAAAGLALGAAPEFAADARAYLREQTDLTRLQKANLLEQNAFELSHLRFRRFSDWAKFALELSVALVVLLLVCGLGTMVWNAAQDRDLVVDAFSVPPDVAQTGMTGNVLAARVLDRFGAMDAGILTFSEDFSGYHGRAADEVRVEIPSTGVSIGEIDRLLRAWLGHETHVSGELVHTAKGLAVTVRYDGQPGVTAGGPADGLDALIQTSAENMFAAVRPLRFADYLSSHNRFAEALAIIRRESATGDAAHRVAAYLSWTYLDFWEGDNDALAVHSAMALALDPANPVAHFAHVAAANNVDHNEALYVGTKAFLAVARDAAHGEIDPVAAAATAVSMRSGLLADQGDGLGAIATCRQMVGPGRGACDASGFGFLYAGIHDIEQAQRALDRAPLTDGRGRLNFAATFTRSYVALAAGDIPRAIALSARADALSAADPGEKLDREIFFSPLRAEALARGGQIAAARAIIAATRTDCDACALARGRVEAAARDWAGAARWFKLVSDRSPHIPFADADWGRMLLAKGDPAAAIAKFASAHAKGPRFADPLEMWGEALIATNRSDLALAKFEEAARYAPNWGRLHLKWGEALLWAGDREGAGRQFALAATLVLAPNEAAELARMRGRNG
ncbi:MAG: hypothetical protein WDN01_19330 [Rhizomicrobium sp.]